MEQRKELKSSKSGSSDIHARENHSYKTAGSNRSLKEFPKRNHAVRT